MAELRSPVDEIGSARRADPVRITAAKLKTTI